MKQNGEGFTEELICDKDSATNATFCRHFPEGMVTYCSNHTTKNLHKALEKLKKYKCEVIKYLSKISLATYFVYDNSAGQISFDVKGCQTVC